MVQTAEFHGPAFLPGRWEIASHHCYRVAASEDAAQDPRRDRAAGVPLLTLRKSGEAVEHRADDPGGNHTGGNRDHPGRDDATCNSPAHRGQATRGANTED